jgi:GT2 family glycosyltransferase
LTKKKQTAAQREQKLSAAAAAAWQDGRAAWAAGDRFMAILWLERAARLAPNDPRIALDLAHHRLADGGRAQLEEAAQGFGDLAARHDLAEAWLGLTAARRLLGDHPAAGAALGEMLRRHCVPAMAGFGDYALQVAAAAGAAGWCGLTEDGALRTGGAAGAKFSYKADGKTVRLRGETAPLCRELSVAGDGKPLLGSPLRVAALRRVEGVVDYGPAGLMGWASRPAAFGAAPALALEDGGGRRVEVAFGAVLPPDGDAPFLPRHGFVVPPEVLNGLRPPFCLHGPDGAEILGSPIDPAAWTLSPSPARQRGAPVERLPRRAALAVVVPVYRGLAVTRACLEALFQAAPKRAKIIVVDDATPEPALAAWLDGLHASGKIVLCRHATNQGFPAAANTGILAAGKRDILLLNSDTLVPPGAIETMVEVLYARAETSSVTPFSNAATILNYPDPNGGNPAPDLAAATALNAMARRANGAGAVEIPTGIGFCMVLRHDCVAATGLFRREIFAQGYGEENDWCLRARRLGYSHVAATGAYVAHLGGVSFRSAGKALNKRNANRLNQLYPGYDAMILKYIAADRLLPARRRLDAERFAAGRNQNGAVLLISHQHGGGVARRIESEMVDLRRLGLRALLLFPAAPADLLNTPFPWQAQLTDGATGDYPNLRFTLPGEMRALLRLLKAENIRRVVLHHALGHHPSVRGLAQALGAPQDIVIHDYASFCLRVNLLTRAGARSKLRYCGEPEVAGCVACVARNGDETFEKLGVRKNLARSAAEFLGARRIVAPSADAARRIARHFPGVNPEVTPWEDDRLPVTLKPPGAGRRRIVVVGGIGAAKGFDILIDCAGDAAERDLPLDFLIAGASSEDEKLLATGRIFITGAYKEAETTKLIRSLNGDLAFLPSIWPETWCFALSEAWRAGLYAIAFDLGAQAARIRASERGGLLPLGLPAARINDALLAWQPVLRNSGGS